MGIAGVVVVQILAGGDPLMLIPIRTLEEIAAGRVDLAFRRWADRR